MCNILVVNDDADLLDTYCMLLGRWGYRAVAAGSSEEALEYLGEERPDLILTNISRSGIDGWEFAGMVRSNPETRQIPIIVATGKLITPDQMKRHAHLMDAFLQVPLTPSELKEAFERVLKKRTSSRRRDSNEFEIL